MIGDQLQELMWPGHRKWQEFVERLEGVNGCDFKRDEQGKVTWRCMGGNDKSLATAIMQSMCDVDILGSLTYFEAHGGYCDCEILFNVGTLDSLS
ncbi:MAG: DUF2695 domain-containing protein [Acidobacteriota bacterium]